MRRNSGIADLAAHRAHDSGPAAPLASWVERLAEVDADALDEEGALAVITALERVKRAACAAQARLSVRVDELALERQRADVEHPQRPGAGIGAQVALARMESPHRGGRHHGLAKALMSELPHTLDAMGHGSVSEWQATLVARETACLDAGARRAIDARIAGRLAGWGDAQTVREVRKLVYAADPGAAVARHAQATADRRVTIRPAPDTMCYLTALLPAAQGISAYAALLREADRARAEGDARGKGQVMADALVERVTGQSTATDAPIEVELVMPADSLLGDAHTPAHLSGYGPIPATVARRMVRDTKAEVWVRRLFTRPDSGRLVAMDSRRRRFSGQLRHFVVLRDQFCRMPWCDAPIRHTDHAVSHGDGGPTDAENAQGLCEACNYAKEAAGWRVTAGDRVGRHLVSVTTPTGDQLASTAPDPPGGEPGLPPTSWRPEAPGVWSIHPRAG